MPEDDNKFVIGVETNAGDAAKELKALDEAQKRAASSGDLVTESIEKSTRAEEENTEAIEKNNAALKEKTRLNNQINKNAAKTPPKRKKKRKKKSQEAEQEGSSDKSEEKSADEKEKKAKPKKKGKKPSPSIMGIAEFLGAPPALLRGLAAVTAGLYALKKVIGIFNEVTAQGQQVRNLGKVSGTNAETVQALALTTRIFGGTNESAAQDLVNLASKIQRVKLGERAFSDAEFMIFGNLLSAAGAPGITPVDFLKALHSRFQTMSAGERLTQTLVSPSLALALANPDFFQTLEKNRKRVAIDNATAEQLAKNREVWQQRVDKVMRFGIKAGSDALDAITLQPGEQSIFSSGAKRLRDTWNRERFLDEDLLHYDDVFYHLDDMFDNLQKEKYQDLFKSSPLLRNDPVLKDNFSYNIPAAPNTNTPFNFMSEQTARQIGMSAGNSSNILNFGGITINAPSGNAEDIRKGVIEAGDIVLAALVELDREEAGRFIG